MRFSHILVLAAATALGACAAVETAPQTAASYPEPDPLAAEQDYANPALWLCRADLASDACDTDLSLTVIMEDGATAQEAYRAPEDQPIDCFFVYPTVSTDPGFLSDWSPDHMETSDIELQFARYASECRTFAPLYRQFTLTALRARAGGAAPTGAPPPAGVGGLNDVKQAFQWYLDNENEGRGFVLVGHSQGSGVLRGLIADMIDGTPLQEQLVSAILPGTSIMVPAGKDIGGSFKTVPLCRAEDQIGCVISYATFRAEAPPPSNSLFGRSEGDLVSACTNPGDLAGGGPAVMDAIFWTAGFLNGSGGDSQPPWTSDGTVIQTPFVKVPGLVSAACASKDGYDYLAMTVNAGPGPRTDTLAGDVVRANGIAADWGMHLVDMDIAMGDLLRIVGKQADAYSSK